MRTRLLFSVAAAALIASAGVGYSQDQMKKDQGGTQMNAPSTSQHRGEARSGKRTAGAAMRHRNAQSKKSKAAATEKNEQAQPKGKTAQGPSRGNKAATTGQGSSSQVEKAGTTGQGSSSQVQQKSPRAPNATQTQTQQPGAKSGLSTTGQGAAGTQGAAKLSSEQRTKITSAIKSKSTEFKPAQNVNFSISVGSRVPRTGVTLYTLPPEVIQVYPAWRGYKFILVRDEILVIDPRTYEIVDVLPA
jgi:hypothetical protein